MKTDLGNYSTSEQLVMGRAAHEAASTVDGSNQPWSEANQAKWAVVAMAAINAAQVMQVAHSESDTTGPGLNEEYQLKQAWWASPLATISSLILLFSCVSNVMSIIFCFATIVDALKAPTSWTDVWLMAKILACGIATMLISGATFTLSFKRNSPYFAPNWH